MNTKIKNILKTTITTLVAILVVAGTVQAVGTLTPSGTAGDDTQYTLNDIYAKITADTDATLGSGTMTVPSGTPTASFRTLTEIYNALPDWQTLSNATTTVAEGFYEATNLATVDTDLAAGNIADGVEIFGVTGTVVEETELEWSTEQGSMNWDTAVTTCAGTVDGSTGWRLPTISELLAAISDDWIVDGGADPRFANNTEYWSGTESDGSNAWIAFWFGNVNNSSFGFKTNTFSVRCVR